MKGRKKATALKFLNACGLDCEEIPEQAVKIFERMDLIDYAKPLILQDREEKRLTIGQLAVRYGIAERRIKWIITRK